MCLRRRRVRQTVHIILFPSQPSVFKYYRYHSAITGHLFTGVYWYWSTRAIYTMCTRGTPRKKRCAYDPVLSRFSARHVPRKAFLFLDFGMRASRLTVRGVHLVRLKLTLPRLNSPQRNTRAARITRVAAAMGSDNKPEHPFDYDIYVIGISNFPFLRKY